MINWIHNDNEALRLEYDVEYRFHIKPSMGAIFPEFTDFVSAYNAGTDLDVTWSTGIAGATNFTRTEDILSMIKSYRSYPEFRNERTFQEIIDGMMNGSPMKLPILLRRGNWLRIMSGNTRLNLALILTDIAKARVISV